MYHMKPIINSDVIIDLPTSMYKMKSIFADQSNENNKTNLNVYNERADVSENSCKTRNPDIVQQISNVLKRSTDMENLESRQKIILGDLKELKENLMSMQKELQICSKPTQSPPQPTESQTLSQKKIDVTQLRDIVINVNPNNIPYSLQILKILWMERLSLSFQFYTHSTISNIPSKAKTFQKKCTAHSLTASPNLNITLIWKNVDKIEMINGLSFPIIGESNILRYLVRIGPNEFNYESNGSNCNEVDSQLDMSELLLAAPSTKERQIIFEKLNTMLGKNQFFAGTSMGINDLSLISAIINLNAVHKLSQHDLRKWARCVSTELE